MDVSVGPWRRLSTIDCFKLWYWRKLLRVSWTARRSNQSILKEINLNIHWKDCCWSSNTVAIWWKEPTHWKRPWCWERWRAGGEEGNRGWDGMASPTQWAWVWANSRRQWRTEEPRVLQSMGLQRVGHDLVTEKQQQIITPILQMRKMRFWEFGKLAQDQCPSH